MAEKFAAKKHTTSNPPEPPSDPNPGKIFVIVTDTEPCYDSARKKRTGSKIRYRFQLPEIPHGCWCDFRRDFESGMTLKSIGIKYHCDQRTVRSCIILNKSSSELGHQYAPTKLEPYIPEIERLYQILSSGGTPQSAEQNIAHKADSSPRQLASQSAQTYPSVIPGITRFSRLITQKIAEFGYTGSERLVRNYLRTKFIQTKSNEQGQSSEQVKEKNIYPIRRTDNKESKRA